MRNTLARMESDINDWFEASDWTAKYGTADFTPVCTLTESDREFVAYFDIPGVSKDDLKIEIEGNRLSVSGERKELKVPSQDKQHISESCYGSFYRSFSLPSAVDESKADAHYEDGVLTIQIPKFGTTKVKEIKVH
ncbi:MAG: hypothetical protein BroJett040_14550 [Oligoflexia bacterium]|nr:MAG: hypothetical protein BroJett040_14550 [Oligoflexia bacterium]